MFDDQPTESFDEREERILRFWKTHNIFKLSLEQRQSAPFFSFNDGPPFATGLPHYGHLLAGTIKDVVLRYKTMKGFYAPRRFGWDCHGLPVENEIEKSFSLSGAPSIEAFGIDKFNEECRKIVLRYTHEWEAKVERFGRWVDFSRTWKTMDLSFMESVWWIFKQVYNKGLIYEGYKVMPFSAKLGTPLSNFEATDNYQEVDDPSVVVTFPLEEDPSVALLAWTTTPWTLVSNMAVTVGESITYVKVEYKGKLYILAAEAVSRWFKDETDLRQLGSFTGKELVGKRYLPLFPYFADYSKTGAFRIIADEFVSIEEGTGIVHTAPAFGEADFFACKKENIPLVCPVDNNGRFTEEVPEYSGQFVKDADKQIINRLKEGGRLFYRGTIHHRYPFCWRSDTPLIYKAISSWFLNVESLKQRLITANEEVHWVPNHLKEGRFGNWLAGARDWAISRNRYWGTPIPIWRAEDGEIHVVGSIAELESLTHQKIGDLHRHFVDQLTFVKKGKTFRRVTEVFDCWFESGSMPYAQNHYPFENKGLTEKNFPADFIAEGVDQTRAWFYTLLVLSIALFDKPAYKNVIANGIVLAEDGNKMSKRLKNYPDPDFVVRKYGADAVRLYMLNSPAVKAEDVRFSEKGVELLLRQVLIPLWNAYSFLATYARIYHWQPGSELDLSASIDKWIVSLLNKLIVEVEEGMDGYDLSRAVEPFVGFIDQLTNWYIRRSRRRFWTSEDTPDRQAAFETLWHVLIELCKVAAPFIPFLSEALYQKLRQETMPLSLHLCNYPGYCEELRDYALEEGMEALQLVVSLGHALRKEHKLKVRQPLKLATVICGDEKKMRFLKAEEHLIQEELNVKRVAFEKESHDFVKFSIKPNFRILGKKVGSHMKEAQLLIQNLSQDEINGLLSFQELPVVLGGTPFILLPEDVEITRKVHEGWVAMNAGSLTIALETDLDEELILEGIARELVNKINTMRRNANFEVTDRVEVWLATSELVRKAAHTFGPYIKEEVLALMIHFGSHEEAQAWDINGEPTAIFIERRAKN